MSTQANVPRSRPPLYDTLPVMLPDDHPKYRGMEFVPQRPVLVRGLTQALKNPIKFDTGLQPDKLSRRLRLGSLSPQSTNTLVQYMTDYSDDSDDSMHHHMNGQLHKIWLVITWPGYGDHWVQIEIDGTQRDPRRVRARLLIDIAEQYRLFLTTMHLDKRKGTNKKWCQANHCIIDYLAAPLLRHCGQDVYQADIYYDEAGAGMFT